MRVVNHTRYKRPLDLSILTTAHLFPLLIPVWLGLWIFVPLAIWLEDRGPVFFRQKRVGRDGREFTFLKFRTMVEGADAAGLMTRDEDPRITMVGRVLRQTALDELPQVVNIVKGDMSFVGPRALPVEMHEESTIEEPRFPERLGMTPGLTGVAQLYLPRHCAPRRRLRYDLLYMRKVSPWLDIRLILLAAWNTVTGRWGTGHRKPDVPPEVESTPGLEG